MSIKIEKIDTSAPNLGANVFTNIDLENAIKSIMEYSDSIQDLDEYLNGECNITIPVLAMRNLLDYYKYYYKKGE